MNGRQRVVVGVGFAVLLVVAALGAVAWLRADTYPEDWEEHEIGSMALSADRRTLHVGAEPYLSGSCYEARAEVSTEGEQWTVVLEARRTEDFCTAEGCIGGGGATVARQLDPGESLGCAITTLELDEPVPDGVRVVPA